MTDHILQDSPTSDQIRVMACDMFCRDGYKGVGMRRLAAAVGIQAGSLYHHIDSKQALLSELITEYEQNLLQVYRSATLRRAGTAFEMVSLLWEKVEQYVTENMNLARLAYKEGANLTAMQTKRIIVVRQRTVRELHRLLVSMPDVGLSDAGLRAISQELYTLVDCNAKLMIDQDAQSSEFVRRQLRNMASMLIIKRD